MKTFGNTNIETSEDASTFVHPHGSKFTATENGLINKIFVYVATVYAATDLFVAVYADNNGVPGALLSHFEGTHSIGIQAGHSWVWQQVSNCPIEAGKTYWLIVWSPTPAADMVFKQTGVNSGQSAFDPDAVPMTWNDPFHLGFLLDRVYSIYAELV